MDPYMGKPSAQGRLAYIKARRAADKARIEAERSRKRVRTPVAPDSIESGSESPEIPLSKRPRNISVARTQIDRLPSAISSSNGRLDSQAMVANKALEPRRGFTYGYVEDYARSSRLESSDGSYAQVESTPVSPSPPLVSQMTRLPPGPQSAGPVDYTKDIGIPASSKYVQGYSVATHLGKRLRGPGDQDENVKRIKGSIPEQSTHEFSYEDDDELEFWQDLP